jgi:hypothetical protein
MVLVAITTQWLTHMAVVWRCCVAHTMQKSQPLKRPPAQRLVAKRRKQQKKLRSEQWRFEMATDG